MYQELLCTCAAIVLLIPFAVAVVVFLNVLLYLFTSKWCLTRYFFLDRLKGYFVEDQFVGETPLANLAAAEASSEEDQSSK